MTMRSYDWGSMFGDSQGHPQSEQRKRTENAVRVNERTMQARIRSLAERNATDAYLTTAVKRVHPEAVQGCLCRARKAYEDVCGRCGRETRAPLREPA